MDFFALYPLQVLTLRTANVILKKNSKRGDENVFIQQQLLFGQ